MRNRAFTFVEVLVVLLILAVLIAMLLPALRRTKNSAEDIQSLSAIRQMHGAMTLYTHDHGLTYPFFGVPGNPEAGIWINGFHQSSGLPGGASVLHAAPELVCLRAREVPCGAHGYAERPGVLSDTPSGPGNPRKPLCHRHRVFALLYRISGILEGRRAARSEVRSVNPRFDGSASASESPVRVLQPNAVRGKQRDHRFRRRLHQKRTEKHVGEHHARPAFALQAEQQSSRSPHSKWSAWNRLLISTP